MEVRILQAGGIAGISQAQLLELGRIDLACAVMARAQFLDPPGVDIEADHRHTGPRKGDRDRKADIAKADDGDLASVCHEKSFPTRTCLVAQSCGEPVPTSPDCAPNYGLL